MSTPPSISRPLQPDTEICLAGHGVLAGDKVMIDGKVFTVQAVTDACSFTLRKLRWYDVLIWRAKKVWKWLVGIWANIA